MSQVGAMILAPWEARGSVWKDTGSEDTGLTPVTVGAASGAGDGGETAFFIAQRASSFPSTAGPKARPAFRRVLAPEGLGAERWL